MGPFAKTLLGVITAAVPFFGCVILPNVCSGAEQVDVAKAKAIYEKSQAGGKLSDEEQKYLDWAKAEMRKKGNPGSTSPTGRDRLRWYRRTLRH